MLWAVNRLPLFVNRLHRSAVSRRPAGGVGRSSDVVPGSWTRAFEFQRRELPEARVRAHLVELPPELFDRK